MKRFTLILSLMVAMVTTAMAGDIVASTNEASPEKVFTMVSGNNASVGADAAPGDGRFAFFAVEGVENAYYIYSVTKNQWFSYAKADGYNNGAGFVTLSDTKENYFHFEKINNGYYQIRPYNNSGVAAKYLNYFGGASEGVKLGLWQDNGNTDAGSRYLIEEYVELVTVNTLEDFQSNKYYTVSTSGRGGWSVQMDTEGNYTQFCSTNDAGLGTTVDKTNSRNQFAVLTVDNENYYLYNIAAQKFVKADRTLVAGVADALALTDASSQGAGRVRINFRDVNNSYINLGGSNQMTVDWWGTIDGGNAVLFVEAGEFDSSAALAMLSNVADVTYNFVCGGVTLATQTVTVAKGEAYPAFNVTLPLGYRIAVEKPAGNVEATTTVEIAVVVDNSLLPFNAVAEGTPTTWYYAQMHAHPSYHWFVAPAEGGIATAGHKFAASEVEAHLWGFVGTVEAGFKMVNKATGEAIKSNNSGVAEMAAVADATSFIAMGSQAGGNYFCLRHPQGNYLNSQSNVINHWGDNDNGSSFLLTEYVDEDVTVTVSELGWATKYFAEPVHVPADVNAYIVTGAKDGWITKSQIAEGEVIPANTGILLENAGEHKFAKTVIYNYTLADNLLNGSVENKYVEGTAYVLANHKEAGIGFYKAELNKDAEGNEGTTHFLNNAGKAYMVLPAASETAAYYGLDWDGTTGVENVVVENEVKVIYDLTGRRVEAITAHGIYVVNGKKVLVK